MKLKKPSNTSIYGTTNFDYKATYNKLRKSKDIRSISQTQKGHITCWFKEYKVFVEISPKGNVIVYYDQHDDHINAIKLLLDSHEKLIVCDNFQLVRDVPRTLQAMREGIESSLGDLIDPELLERLNFDKYVLSTAAPKTYRMVAEGISNYLTKLSELYEHDKALEVLENTTEWIITFGVEITKEIFPELTYIETCDILTNELTSTLENSPYNFRLYGDDRDGEGLSLRYAFIWCPRDGPLELPQFPFEEHWKTLELVPFKELYPDSDFE